MQPLWICQKSAVRKRTKNHGAEALYHSRTDGGQVIDYRRQTSSARRVDPVLVAVNEDVAKHERFHLIHRHVIGWNLIDQLFIGRSKEAPHVDIVIAMVNAAETLNSSHVLPSQATNLVKLDKVSNNLPRGKPGNRIVHFFSVSKIVLKIAGPDLLILLW